MDVYNKAEVAYFNEVRDSIPEWQALNQAFDAYYKSKDAYAEAHETLPQLQALRSFTEANKAACKEEIKEAYEERKQRLSKSQLSRPNQSSSSSNSSGSSSQKSGSGKAVQ